jgi:DnaK suppressor protein
MAATSAAIAEGEPNMAELNAVSQEQSRLLAEEQQVIDELTHLREAMLAEVDIDPEEGDAEITEREKNAALLAVLESKLQDIQTALRSIEKGSYGICARCGNPIEPGRLEVKPDATLCVGCQSEVERLSRRGRNTRQIQW